MKQDKMLKLFIPIFDTWGRRKTTTDYENTSVGGILNSGDMREKVIRLEITNDFNEMQTET